jgi:hypothetical protein
VRQPIYIECAAESVTIQPEGIELPLRVLASGAAGRNALSRAIGALCDFWPKRWQAEGHAADDEQCTPYPLLLVRPEGVMSYHAARAALEPLGLPFGYELVERDWMLRYPEPDLDARAVALAAIRERSPTRHAFATGRGTNGQAASDGVQNRSTELTHGADELLASVASQTADSPLESGDDPTAGPEPVDSAADRSHDHASPAGAVGGTPRDPTRGTVGVNPAARQPVLDSGVPRRAAPVTSSRSPARAATPRSAQSGVSSGEDFAAEPRLPANPEGGGKIAVPRSIRVDCAADRVVVGERAATIALTGAASPDAALGQLFEEIDREVHDWGPAGTTFRWVPKLQFRVQPDALETFYGLRFALAGSSLQIEHEVVLD